jgi:hypothetical protein
MATPYIVLIFSLISLRAVFSSLLPHWARIAFGLTVLSGVVYAVLGIWLHRIGYHSPNEAFVEHYKTFFGGIWLGLMASLFPSGQVKAKWSGKR